MSILMYSCSNTGRQPQMAADASADVSSEKSPFLFEEKFDSVDPEIWEYQLYSFEENGCRMTRSQVLCLNSVLTIVADFNPTLENKKYIGGEIATIQAFRYGSFTVRMKNDIAPGSVSAFFLMNKWKPEHWEHKEIDIEFLGKDLTKVQLTVHHFTEGGKKHITYPHLHDLGFDSSKDFHDYTIVWHPDSISWLVDHKWVHSEKRLLFNEEMNIRINHYIGEMRLESIRFWLGPVNETKLPSKVHYDNITVIK